MTQEPNNLNQNNFNTQGNNGIPNDQPLNNNINQEFNNTFSQQQNVNQSTINQQLQTNNTPPKPLKKINLGLIIGIIVGVVAIGIVGAVLLLGNNNNDNNNSENSANSANGNNNSSNNYINGNANDMDKLIMILKKGDNQKYLVQFNEINIAKNFNCSNDKCGNGIININSISQILDNTIYINLNSKDYTISISKNTSSYDKIIKESNNSYIYYNELLSCYMYYFKINGSYIQIQPINNKDICSNEENALQLFDYFNDNLTVMTATVDENTKKVDFNSIKDANNSFIDVSHSYFVNDFIFDYVHSLGFKINNPLDVNFYSNNKNRAIDLNLNYLVNKPNLEKINFEITFIDKSDFNNFKEKEEISFNIGIIEIIYYSIDESGVYMVIDANNNYFKIKATGTYFTNDTSINSLKEVLNELLKENK